MSDNSTTVEGSHDGEQAMSQLADRITAMAPPPTVLELSDPAPAMVPPPSEAPAVASSAVTAEEAAPPAATEETAPPAVAAAPVAARRRRSLVGLTLSGFVAACAFIPYALVALVLRLVMARVFFLDGQTRIDGPHFAYSLHGFDFSLVLPLQVKAETVSAFLTHYAALPLPPLLAAYLLSAAEFILPVMLVLGLGTRVAALGLMIITALIQVYVLPSALWTTHIYWAAILLVLLSRGPGQVSLDQLVRWLARPRARKGAP